MTEPTLDALHAETLETLARETERLNEAIKYFGGGSITEGAQDAIRHYAYAAECVTKRAELEAEVERLTASKRKLTTMLEEEAYHRMAAENRAEPDSGNVRIEITDSAEVERLQQRIDQKDQAIRNTTAVCNRVIDERNTARDRAEDLRDEVERLREYAGHLEWCATCAEDGIESCIEGRDLRAAATREGTDAN